ncbi:MAG: M13 family metallopeptidase [Thermoanaerobaculales bacterium]
MKQMIIGAVCLLMFTGCNREAGDDATQAASTSGIDRSKMDLDVRPQDDFYSYVNGTWLETAEIPADRTTTGVFRDLREKAREDVLKIIQDLAGAENLAPGSDEQKVADLYNSFMDTDRLEALGLSPLGDELEAIAAIGDKSDLSAYFAHSRVTGIGGPFISYISIDGKDATRYAAHVHQSGLGLPDRDYYFKDDDRSVEVRAAYVAHIEKMFELTGFDAPRGSAAMLMALETRLADVHWTRVENRDRDKTYNKFAISELGALGDGFDWDSYLSAVGIDGEKDIIIRQPTYIEGFNRIFAETSLDDWKTFMKWKLLNSRAGVLNTALDQERFDFYDRILNGQQEQRPRWKRGVDTVNGSLGEVIGKVYVGRHFSPEAKARMVELVENLRGAYAAAIEELEWMGPETKAAALEKLARFTPKIGYPDIWEDYSKLEIVPGDLVGNLARASRFEWELDRSKLGGPIRKWEWGMTPQTVNAYYNPSMNEVVFPAAILQPPFFNMAADDAVNYGAIGAVIGHEMGHGFDDQGSKFDADGNLRNWWTDSDREEFKKRTRVLVDQYARFEVLDGVSVNGELTLGENIGDLAGLTIAFKAYQRALDGREAPVIDEMTGAQRFFIGIGQVWRYKATEETMRNRVATDTHSPPRYRVMGSLANMPEFYEAFNVQEEDGMYLPPEERVKIW